MKFQNCSKDETYFLPPSFRQPFLITYEDDTFFGYGPHHKIEIGNKECIVYTDRLNWLLRSQSVEVADIVELDPIIIDGTKYKDSYKSGYEDGEVYFSNIYKPDKSDIYKALDVVVETLRAKCFEDCNGYLWTPGWDGVRHSHIGRFNHKIIWEHGYYAGIFRQIEELVRLYKPLKQILLSSPLTAPALDKSDTIAYNSFEELFINLIDIEKCIDALRRYRPEKSVLGEGRNWTGVNKDKGVIVAWIERMEGMRKPKIRRLSNRKRLVMLLNNFFLDLNMGKDARVFSNPVDLNVKQAFEALMPD
ncbi:hypothetical protein [Larkinella terrae]|uniref:Uncharacterized protein n=1 Tax=Larkinella terrae TaxID=2025311 RepID=A0A7K0EHZ3_9BACT|nr:hypothetical protein [Larkinella terrae]MRS61211.1 hypothetical protein [Larkinella terrae]